MISSKKFFENLIWQFLEKSGTKIVSLVVSIVLARLLLPSDYGILAIVLVFVNLCDVFIIYGFGNSLVQKKDADNIDFSTIFYTQILLSFFIYGILYISAPYISNFYGAGYEIITPAIRILGLNVIIIASSNVQTSIIAKKMKFKLSFFVSLIGTLSSAVIGIIMALKGFGVWALIVQALSSSIINSIILWIIAKWVPSLVFSFSRLKQLFSFGWKLLCVGLLENLYLELRSLIIGKMYTSESLAHYNRGEQFPKIISVTVNSSIKTVLFSAVAKEQENLIVLKKMIKRSLKTSSYLLFPLLIGLLLTADHLVPLLLTDKWIPSIPYLRLFCVVYMFMPLQTTNMQVYKGVGKSGLSLFLEIIKKIIGVSGLLLTMKHGPISIASAFAITTILNAIISAIPNSKIIKYGVLEQLYDILPNLLLSLSFAVPVYAIGRLQLHHALILVMQVVVSVILYVLLSELFKHDSYIYLKNLILSYVKRKK